MRKVFIINPNTQYESMFNEHNDYILVDEAGEADLIQFTGGSDVTPSYYGEEAHPTTHNNPARDQAESIIFKLAFGQNIPMAGICRGGQFLHVMNGGKMYQHVDGHCGDHLLRDEATHQFVRVSSTHHQMMRDAYVEDGVISKILAVALNIGEYKESMADDPRSGPREQPCGGVIVRSKEWPVYDLEAIYYPVTRSLCFQPHPEFVGVEECRELYFRYLDDYIFNTE